MRTSIYAVQGPTQFRLVEAYNKQAALRHVAKDILSVERASQKTLVAAMNDGIKVELAGAEEPAIEATE
jgi:hypothetical protein